MLPAFDPHFADLALERPVLAIVIDAEEEFDWDGPFDPANTATTSIQAQALAHEIYDRYAIRPTYVVDYPVASTPDAIHYLRSLVEEGRALVGAHLHPWVCPPHHEILSRRDSYAGNLPRALERDKLRVLTDMLQQAMGSAPWIFKAGRYGLGPNTFELLKEMGYRLDCSFVPHYDFSADGGPCYHHQPDRPFFTDSSRTLLEVPLSAGFYGPLHKLGNRFPKIWSKGTEALHMTAALSNTGLLTRARLSPEGLPIDVLKRLTRSLYRQGHRVFTLSYHSPSLAPGNTPYVRNSEDLSNFLKRIDQFLHFFTQDMQGDLTDFESIHHRSRSATP